MNLSNLHCLACLSFSKKFVRKYFTTLNIIKGFFVGIFLSIFLVFHYFGFNNWLFYTIPAFIGFYILLQQKSAIFFFSGFFIGLFWFYWIGFSFIHYGFGYLLPLGVFVIATGYGLIFLIPSLISDNPWIKGVLLTSTISFFAPFGFNWLDFRLLLLNTPFGLDYLSLFAFIFMVISIFTCKGWWRVLTILFLILSLNTKQASKINTLPFPIALTQSTIPQDDKWKEELRSGFINENIKKIDKAIKEKKRVIIFPESAFPLYLNHATKVANFLKKRSKNITIITGALTYKDSKFFNSTYVFDKGKMQIFNKVLLVPFGEEIPMPGFIKKWINEIFYDGAEDFSTAPNPQDYMIDDIKIRNAICFEATTSLLYKDNPNIMIAMSNNAWFTPSFEPLMQHLLLQLYANLNNTTIYHSINGSKSEIIYPKQNLFLYDFRGKFKEFVTSR